MGELDEGMAWLEQAKQIAADLDRERELLDKKAAFINERERKGREPELLAQARRYGFDSQSETYLEVEDNLAVGNVSQAEDIIATLRAEHQERERVRAEPESAQRLARLEAEAEAEMKRRYPAAFLPPYPVDKRKPEPPAKPAQPPPERWRKSER